MPDSQFTAVPIAIFTVGSVASASVLFSRCSSEFCTSLALLSFFSREGIAVLFGGATWQKSPVNERPQNECSSDDGSDVLVFGDMCASGAVEAENVGGIEG